MRATYKIIAIDGPAASGKSTVAKLVASKLGYLYIDTGAMYRAITLAWLEKYHSKSNLEEDEQRLVAILENFDLKLRNNSKEIILNDRDISEAIRANEISKNVSYVSSFKLVRERLVELQRKIAQAQNVVLDGRDIGTVVFPQADLKIFMIASAQVRAARRLKDLEAKGEKIALETLIQEISMRDKEDSERKESPLRKAEGAIEINTDNLTVAAVVQEILRLAR